MDMSKTILTYAGRNGKWYILTQGLEGELESRYSALNQKFKKHLNAGVTGLVPLVEFIKVIFGKDTAHKSFLYEEDARVYYELCILEARKDKEEWLIRDGLANPFSKTVTVKVDVTDL